MKQSVFVAVLLLSVFSCKDKNVENNTTVSQQNSETVKVDSAKDSLIQNKNSEGSPGSNLLADESSLTGEVDEFNIEINLSADVLFDFDKFDLKPSADAELQKAAEVISKKGKGLITITGYTDAKGSDSYNKTLSEKRAESVKNWFVSHNLKHNFQTFGKGAADPVAPNTNADGSDNPEGRAKNRRVVIIVNKTKTLGE